MLAPLLLALLAAQPPAGSYALDPAASALRFLVVHPLHDVHGRAPVVEARAELAPDGALRAQARAEVARFETGDGNRDVNMRAALEVERFPYVVLKAAGRLEPPASLPAEVALTVSAELDLHGVKRQLEIPLTVRFEANGAARATGSFPVSLDEHGIERPSLLFRKVDDRCRVEVDLLLRREGA
jgi:polyisoprenoid-binding protein YceI